jgi:hypothetical protein
VMRPLIAINQKCVSCVEGTHVGLQTERLTDGAHRNHKGRRQIRRFVIFVVVGHLEVIKVAFTVVIYPWHVLSDNMRFLP